MPLPEPIGSPDTVRIRPTTALALHLVRAAVIFALAVLIALVARRRIELPIQRFRDRLAPRSIAPSPLLAPIGTGVRAD